MKKKALDLELTRGVGVSMGRGGEGRGDCKNRNNIVRWGTPSCRHHLPSSSSNIITMEMIVGLGKCQCGVTLALAPRLWGLTGINTGRDKNTREEERRSRFAKLPDRPWEWLLLLLAALAWGRGNEPDEATLGEARSEVVKPRGWAGLA